MERSVAEYLIKLAEDLDERASFAKNPKQRLKKMDIPQESWELFTILDAATAASVLSISGVTESFREWDKPRERYEFLPSEPTAASAKRGSLTLVGSGIRLVGDMTLDAVDHIRVADVVLFLVADPAARAWIERQNSKTRDLFHHYSEHVTRMGAYDAMVREIMDTLREGVNVCVVVYGHPGIFVNPTHRALRIAREEGFMARMLPGISADAHLFADAGLDPSDHGCQSFEATEFIAAARRPDTTSALILWQIGFVGIRGLPKSTNRKGLGLLAEVLQSHYGPDHVVIVYTAASWPIHRATMERTALRELPNCRVPTIATLFVPPKEAAPFDKDRMQRLEAAKD